MDYSYSEDQQSIADLAERIFREQVTDDQRIKDNGEFNQGLWQTLSEAGLLVVDIAEKSGGLAMGFIAQCLVLEHLGRALASVPLMETYLSAWAIEQAEADELLTPVTERSGYFSLSLAPGLQIKNGTVSGSLNSVLYANDASQIIAYAGEELVCIDPSSEGVELERQHTTSGQACWRVTVNAPCRKLGGKELLATLKQRLQVATSCIQLGVAEEALKRTSEYATERKQFGKPLAAFQAVSHRAANGYIDIEALRAVIQSAMWRIQEGLDSPLEAGAARWWANETGHRISHTAQHLHGGIGADLEYPIHRFFLWSKQLEFSLSGAQHTLGEMGQLLGSNDLSGVRL